MVSNLHQNYKELLGKEVTICGWVTTTRPQKETTFIKLNDGSDTRGVQIIVATADAAKYKTGCSLEVVGTLVESPSPAQPFEVNATKITILGSVADDYPLAKSKLSLEYLRSYQHLRARTSTFGSVFRIKSAISHATHDFFRSRGYLHLDPNVMTINECEGGAGVFQVTERDISKPTALPLKTNISKDASGNTVRTTTNDYDWGADHFGRPVYLTVSSQLQLEAIACSLGSVYTTNKSFRSEHSNTAKHLSEFTHLEIETCFLSLSELMDVAEDYIRFVANYLLTAPTVTNDIDNLNAFVSKGIKARVEAIASLTIFNRIPYTEAIEIAQEAGKTIKFGEDLSSEIENFLTDHYGGPVFVYNWPSSIKSFYMKQDPTDPTLCNNFDLLMPFKVGEMIGGSMREDDYHKLIAMMKQKGVSEELMRFYTDLRRFGTVPHGGFGLGFDRMTMLFTGMENIRDAVPFPVAYKSCEY